MSIRKRALETVVCVAVLLQLLGCGGGAGPTSPTPTPTLPRASLTDPAGDAGNAPDIVSATLEAANGVLTIQLRFAPGSFDRTNYNVIGAYLNTDRNAATGDPGSEGAEYLWLMSEENNSRLVRWVTGGYSEDVVSIPVTSVANGLDFTIPLSSLGSSDGRVHFRFLGSGRSLDVDWAPNLGTPAGSVQ